MVLKRCRELSRPDVPSPRNVPSAGSRSASPETVIVLQDLNATIRQLVGWSDIEISRASEGDLNETIDMALNKFISENDLGSFKTRIGFAYEVKYAEAKSDVVNFACKTIKQEQ